MVGTRDYYYRAYSFRGSSHSSYSNIVTVLGADLFSSYCTPLNLVLAAITGGVRLTWAQSAQCTNEDGFEIWISINGGAYALLDTVAADVLTYDDMTDYAGSTVDYKVRAYRGTAYSEYSDEESITIAATITNLAVVWAEDHAVLTWDETTGWDTEIYSSLDNTNWTLDTTIATGTETYADHCWQGTTVYFRARAKLGALYGNYCSSINIATPLVFKIDCNPLFNFVEIETFNLPAGKTVNIDWGDGHNTNYTTTGNPAHNYSTCGGTGVADPQYIKISGDLASITTFYIAAQVKCYGDLSKWYIPGLSSTISFNINSCLFSGDLTSWAFTLPSTLVDIRLYNNDFIGDLSNLIVNTSAATILYLTTPNGKCEFTAPPRGTLHQCEAGVAGLYMLHANMSTAAIDAWLAWFNTYLVTHTPVRNSLFMLSGTGNGIPTGGNANANRLGIIAKYTAAGFTGTVTVNT